MYHIYFYENPNGESPVYEWIKKLAGKKGKTARINAGKVNDYITLLQEKGLSAGMPFMRHLEGDLWELRPLQNRIIFAAWNRDGFVLLHHFQKKTAKTPKRELEQAERELKDYRRRWRQ